MSKIVDRECVACDGRRWLLARKVITVGAQSSEERTIVLGKLTDADVMRLAERGARNWIVILLEIMQAALTSEPTTYGYECVVPCDACGRKALEAMAADVKP